MVPRSLHMTFPSSGRRRAASDVDAVRCHGDMVLPCRGMPWLEAGRCRPPQVRLVPSPSGPLKGPCDTMRVCQPFRSSFLPTSQPDPWSTTRALRRSRPLGGSGLTSTPASRICVAMSVKAIVLDGRTASSTGLSVWSTSGCSRGASIAMLVDTLGLRTSAAAQRLRPWMLATGDVAAVKASLFCSFGCLAAPDLAEGAPPLNIREELCGRDVRQQQHQTTNSAHPWTSAATRRPIAQARRSGWRAAELS
eukprot:366417-Chlamydomonas_euryale.AAC.12